MRSTGCPDSTGCSDNAGPGRAGQEGDAGGVQGEQTRRQVRREDGGAPRGPGERPSTDRIIRVSEVAITLGFKPRNNGWNNEVIPLATLSRSLLQKI